MSTGSSKVEPTIEAFKALLATQPIMLATPQVLLIDGPPGPNQPDDIVAVATRTEENNAPHALVGTGGPGRLRTDMIITVVVSCFAGGEDGSVARKRANLMVQAIHDTVNGDPTLSGTCYDAWLSRAQLDTTWEPDHKGHLTEGEVEITCQSIIT